MQHLEALSNAAGVSGLEDAVRRVVLGALRAVPGLADVQIDALGNVLARLPATPGATTGPDGGPLCVMLAAHMDEVGFLVTGWESDGTLRVTAVGGLDARILPGARVRVGATHDAPGLPGVFPFAPIHRSKGQDVVKLSDLRVDIGATSKAQAQAKAPRGTQVTFDTRCEVLAGSVWRGKAFDDRVGCAVLLALLAAGPYPVEVLAAFTVQEEVGLRGARVAAQRLRPHAAIALEGTTAHDLPDPHADPDRPADLNPTCRLRGGPVISLMDRTSIAPPRLLAHLRRAATDAGVPTQTKAQLGGGTDAGAMQVAGGGAPAIVVSVPCRYIHSPAALLDVTDALHTVTLVAQALRTLDAAAIHPDRAPL